MIAYPSFWWAQTFHHKVSLPTTRVGVVAQMRREGIKVDWAK